MLGDSGAELGGVSEDGSPFADSLKVVTHVLAVVESLGDLEDHDTEFEDSLNSGVPTILGKLAKSELNLVVEHITALVAMLDFLKVVLAGHSPDEAAKELGDALGWDGKHNWVHC